MENVRADVQQQDLQTAINTILAAEGLANRVHPISIALYV